MAQESSTISLSGIKIPIDLHERLKEAARKDSRSLSNFIKVHLETHYPALQEHKNEQNAHQIETEKVDPWKNNEFGL